MNDDAYLARLLLQLLKADEEASLNIRLLLHLHFGETAISKNDKEDDPS